MGVEEEFNTDMLQDLLPIYYKQLFPTNLMYRWLSYNDNHYFARREFSFTLPGDVYIRFQSFDSEQEFQAQLDKKKPEKIDIGAVYNQKPKSRSSDGSFLPESKEFILDIDLTDYDEVRTCCSGAKVCKKCWKFLAVAVEILDAALREDFGFKNLLWIFSGRRGVHCWVCDELARGLDTSGRVAVAEYLSLIKVGKEKQPKKLKFGERAHPSIKRAQKIVAEHFEDICREDQAIFDIDKNLDVLPDEVKAIVRGKISQKSSDVDRWETILKQIDEKYEKFRNRKGNYNFYLAEVQLYLIYPRLDIHVSKGLNHLLKSPFCIHPKTGKVCVPFEARHAYAFDIDKVPTVTQLIDEIGKFDKDHQNSTNMDKWKKTAMKPSMEIFRKFVKGLQKGVKVQETMDY